MEWVVNPNPKATNSSPRVDHFRKKVFVEISQVAVSGGTFGHESEHAIMAMLLWAAVDKAKAHNVKVDQELLKKVHEEYRRHVIVPNDYATDNKEDSPEHEATRTAYVIIAERIASHLGRQKGLTAAEKRKQFTVEWMKQNSQIRNNTNSGHQNVARAIKDAERFGRETFERLYEAWEREEREEMAKKSRQR